MSTYYILFTVPLRTMKYYTLLLSSVSLSSACPSVRERTCRVNGGVGRVVTSHNGHGKRARVHALRLRVGHLCMRAYGEGLCMRSGV